METYWASSKEEEQKIVDAIISNYSYESIPTSFQTGINIPVMTSGTLLNTVAIELSNENPNIAISYGQSREAMGLFPWGLTADFHEISRLTWGKEKSAEAGAVFGTLTSPISVSTGYTYITYEELLKEYKNIKSENDYFREQLSAINTPQKLQKYSLFYGFLSILSLVFANFLGINLVHPVIAYLAFLSSAFFYGLGVLIDKHEAKKYSGQ